MEINYIKTQDFYKGCLLLSEGYELVGIYDNTRGIYPTTAIPTMIFLPSTSFKAQDVDKEELLKSCVRSLYNQLKVRFVLAKTLEFKNDTGRHDLFTSAVNPPWVPFLA